MSDFSHFEDTGRIIPHPHELAKDIKARIADLNDLILLAGLQDMVVFIAVKDDPTLVGENLPMLTVTVAMRM